MLPPERQRRSLLFTLGWAGWTDRALPGSPVTLPLWYAMESVFPPFGYDEPPRVPLGIDAGLVARHPRFILREFQVHYFRELWVWNGSSGPEYETSYIGHSPPPLPKPPLADNVWAESPPFARIDIFNEFSRSVSASFVANTRVESPEISLRAGDELIVTAHMPRFEGMGVREAQRYFYVQAYYDLVLDAAVVAAPLVSPIAAG